ncbi:transposase [Planctomicrobium sp. SH661]|uniref:transposase n=1 Tax=Planctomicrobium sp. SH661 TaxID=3448124 RepID=UPI003F5BBA32
MIRLLDRNWLITSTTYGTWLPGDQRGFVSPVRDVDGSLVTRNVFQSPIESDHPRLQRVSRSTLKSAPVYLNQQQADTIVRQFAETCRFRNWTLVATSCMRNHFHAVLSVSGDPEPATLLRDLKGYASRALNQQWPAEVRPIWWTESGSKRKLPGEQAVKNAVAYVWNQQAWLARYKDGEVPCDWLNHHASK